MKELRQEYWSKVIRREMSAQKGNWEIAISERQMDSVRKEIPVVLTTGLVLVKEHNHPLLLRRRRLRLKEESLAYFAGASPSGLNGGKPCRNFLKGKCTESPCDLWHPPVCLNHKSEPGCKYRDKCHFRHTEVGGQPSKKSKKSDGKRISGIIERDDSIGLRVP